MERDRVISNYFNGIKVLAAVAVVTAGLLESVYNPGMLDTVNGLAIGLVIYALWRA